MKRDFNNGSLRLHARNTYGDRLLDFDDAARGAICTRKEPVPTGAVAVGARVKNRKPHGNASTLSRFLRREKQIDIQSFEPLALGYLPFREVSDEAFV